MLTLLQTVLYSNRILILLLRQTRCKMKDQIPGSCSNMSLADSVVRSTTKTTADRLGCFRLDAHVCGAAKRYNYRVSASCGRVPLCRSRVESRLFWADYAFNETQEKNELVQYDSINTTLSPVQECTDHMVDSRHACCRTYENVNRTDG